MKIKKQFIYKNLTLTIVEREEPYMNGGNVLMTRVLAPNGGSIPISIQRRQTLKSIIENTIELLDGFEKRGCDVCKELTKKI